MRLVELYGLPIATAVLGVTAAVLAIVSGPAAAAIAAGGAVGLATIDVWLRHRFESRRQARETQALTQLGIAARRFRERLAAELPLGGTGVPEQPDRVAAFAEWIRAGRFSFLKDRAWRDWEKVALLVERGCEEIRSVAALVGDRLPSHEEERVRHLRDLGVRTTANAFEIGSALAGFDLEEEPRGSRYGPDRDADVDVSSMAAYASFGEQFTALVTELDRLSAMDRSPRDPRGPRPRSWCTS